MGFVELFILAVGLSMDAFAVAVLIGLDTKASVKNAFTVGVYFGFFQGAMPLLGYLLAGLFADSISVYDHWIAFFLLCFIGGKMIAESFKKEEKHSEQGSLKPKRMIPLAFATSIDALAVGVSFAFLQVEILPAILFIGLTTLLLAMAGVKIGNAFGSSVKNKAELAGGIVLILLGIKILVEHLGAFQ